MKKKTPSARRPVKARRQRWAIWAAKTLAKAGVRPNTVSILSLVFAVLAGACMVLTLFVGPWQKIGFFLAAAVLVPLRLICNLLDGMLAIEGGFRSKTGDLYNEIPDRISDAVILVCAGYSAPEPGPILGWTAALLAVLTAYIRALAGASGAKQHFVGPMAKQQRMMIVIACCILAAVEVVFLQPGRIMIIGLALIALGSLVTVVRRIGLTARDLNNL